MKFLVDMPASPQLAKWLNEKGYDAVHASDIGLYKTKDREILEEARKHNRIIITADLDFPQLLAISHAKDPGIILFRGGNYNEKEMCNLLKRVLDNVKEEKIVDSIIVVDKTRIRRCPLPIE
jgi:predicted nuclease of predicted toxin-antitoxin system